jgi:outer membrane protein assembly factor BamB
MGKDPQDAASTTFHDISQTNIMKLNLILIGVFICISAWSQNWNRFRGVNGEGIFPKLNLPTKWQKRDYTWAVTLPGVGHSSPVLWGDKIFTTCASPNDAVQFILAFDAKTGRKLWQEEYLSAPYQYHKFNSYASSTPAVDEDFLFVSWTTKRSNELRCFDHQGNLIWERSFGAYLTQHGNGFSPIVHKQQVFVTHDHEGESALFALNRKNGKTLWKLERIASKPSSSTPVIYESPDGKTYVVSNSKSHGCYAVNTLNGEIAWETGSNSLDLRSVSSPYFGSGYFFASCGSGGRGSRFLVVQPPLDESEKVSVKYKITKNAPYVPTSIVINGIIFLLSDSGIASGIDLETGKALWRERINGNFFASPVASGDIVFAISRDGNVFAFNLNKKKLITLGVSQLNEIVHNTPAFSKRGLFFRTNSRLIHLKSKN